MNVSIKNVARIAVPFIACGALWREGMCPPKPHIYETPYSSSATNSSTTITINLKPFDYSYNVQDDRVKKKYRGEYRVSLDAQDILKTTIPNGTTHAFDLKTKELYINGKTITKDSREYLEETVKMLGGYVRFPYCFDPNFNITKPKYSWGPELDNFISPIQEEARQKLIDLNFTKG